LKKNAAHFYPLHSLPLQLFNTLYASCHVYNLYVAGVSTVLAYTNRDSDVR